MGVEENNFRKGFVVDPLQGKQSPEVQARTVFFHRAGSIKQFFSK